MIKKLIWGTLATLFWIAVWFIAALAVGKELILPSPISVAARMLEFFASAAFYETVLHSLARVVLGMVTGAIIGLIGGALTAFSPFVRNLFSPVLSECCGADV